MIRQYSPPLETVLNYFVLKHRADSTEILDEGLASAVETRRSLEDLRRLNRYVFGTRATLGPLQGWLHDAPKPATVLDLGTGSGQMAQALAHWAAREYQAIRIIALDRVPHHLQIAHHWNRAEHTPHVLLLGGDALRLPLPDRSVDYVTSSLFLHHFDHKQLTRLLAECRRVARRGLLMSDLWRHPLPFYLYKLLLQPLLVRSPVTRADSTASFRRAYTPAEIEQIARPLLPTARVTLHLPSFRWRLADQWA